MAEFKIRANAIEADIYLPTAAILKHDSKDGCLVLTLDIDDVKLLADELSEFFQ